MPESSEAPAAGVWPLVRPWLLRLGLAVAGVFSVVLAVQAFSQVGAANDSAQVVWGVVSVICAVAFVAALVFSLRGRLRVKSWLPLVGLVLVVLAAWRQISEFVPPAG